MIVGLLLNTEAIFQAGVGHRVKSDFMNADSPTELQVLACLTQLYLRNPAQCTQEDLDSLRESVTEPHRPPAVHIQAPFLNWWQLESKGIPVRGSLPHWLPPCPGPGITARLLLGLSPEQRGSLLKDANILQGRTEASPPDAQLPWWVAPPSSIFLTICLPRNRLSMKEFSKRCFICLKSVLTCWEPSSLLNVSLAVFMSTLF